VVLRSWSRVFLGLHALKANNCQLSRTFPVQKVVYVRKGGARLTCPKTVFGIIQVKVGLESKARK
jgi:hypothetical protein